MCTCQPLLGVVCGTHQRERARAEAIQRKEQLARTKCPGCRELLLAAAERAGADQ